MKYSIIAFKDRVINVFTTPIIEKMNKEQCVENYTRRFAVEKPEQHANSKHLNMFYLGEYDDNEGKITLEKEPEFLLSVEDLSWVGDKYE